MNAQIIDAIVEFPKMKKKLKLKVNTKCPIKYYIPLFCTKFDTDLGNSGITACIKRKH